jgi:hypothetical protein
MRRIRISYETWTPEDVEAGDTDDRGWIDEEGVLFIDGDADLSAVCQAIQFLRHAGAIHASATCFHPGVWYSTEPDNDIHTGSETIKSYHLDGWTDDEQREIFNAITNRQG